MSFILSSSISSLDTGGAETTVVSSPAANTRRTVRSVILHNTGANAVSVELKLRRSTSTYVLWRATLQSNETLTVDTPFIISDTDTVIGQRVSGTSEVVNFIASYADEW